MNKSQFVKLLASNMNISTNVANQTLKSVLATIGEAVSREDVVAFVGFGTFKTSISKSKILRTPRGKFVNVPQKRFVRFSVGSDLKAKAANKN